MPKFYITIAAAFIILSFNVSAQPPGFNAAFSRMQAQNMQNMMRMNMNAMMGMMWYRGLNYQVNNTYKFTLTMKDGSTKEVKSKIYADTTSHKSYLIYEHKGLAKSDPARNQKIYANETLSISRDGVTIDDDDIKVSGIATDSCWLFKVVKGKINAYSFLSEVDNLDESYIRAFQYGDGKVTKIDSLALDPIVKADPKAYKQFQKKKFYDAIKKYNSDYK